MVRECGDSIFTLNIKHIIMKNSVLLIMASGLMLFTACEKIKENPTPAQPVSKSTKDLVVDGKWQMTGMALVVNNNGTDSLVDAWANVKECDRDNVMTFTNDGKGVIDEMATKCDPADPQTRNITWEFINNDTQVKITDNKGTNISTIVELTATKAIYKMRVAAGADSITIQQTFKNIK